MSQILKVEIVRLANREIDQQVRDLKGQLVELRRISRNQCRRIEQLEKEPAGKVDKVRVAKHGTVSEDDDVRVPRGSVRNHRERPGISQKEMALMPGASPLETNSSMESAPIRHQG